MRLSELATMSLTYRAVGATAGALPDGYHHVRKSAVIGCGRPRFDDAAEKVMRWGMLRGAGVRVEASTEVAAVGWHVLVGFGPRGAARAQSRKLRRSPLAIFALPGIRSSLP